MNSRERFLATTHHEDRDRVFQWEMGPYEETVKRWREEGLPDDSTYAHFAGYDRFERVPAGFTWHMLCPKFEWESLEESDGYETYRDVDGVIKRKLIDAPSPGMPHYVEYPLKGKEDWPEIKRRLDPDSPARFPVHWESMVQQYRDRDFALGLYCGSLFGWLRNWMGIEGISLALYDDRSFIEGAVADIADCVLGVLDKALDGVQYDFADFWEDMAYKTASLINPALYRQIFLPHYRRIVDRLHAAGIDVVMLDCDGNVDGLIPCWLDEGINLIYPMEVSAGMDVVALRKKYGRELLMAGGMDKRVLAQDKAAIKQMVEERIPTIREGGYIPGCDHAIPPDIPWENYVYYRRLLSEVEP